MIHSQSQSTSQEQTAAAAETATGKPSAPAPVRRIRRESEVWDMLASQLDNIHNDLEEAVHVQGFSGGKYSNVRACLLRIRAAADAGIKLLSSNTEVPGPGPGQ